MLRDLVDARPAVVFCGTAASTRAAAIGHYYAGRGNKFWPTLYRVGLTPRQLEPEEDQCVLEYGIGLTDIVKGQAGPDVGIDFALAGPDRVRALVRERRPRFLCFNGKRAAKEFLGRRRVEYGLQPETVGSVSIYVLPSTAGLASRYWDESYWRELAAAVQSSSV